jgi:hypothetical protein
MFTEALTQEMILAGKELIEHLDKTGFKVDACLWFYKPQSNSWRLIIAVPEAKLYEPRKAYSKILSILAKIPSAKDAVSLSDITLIESKDPLIRTLRTAARTGRIISGIRFSRNTIDGVFIEDAYIYRII